MKKKQVKSKYLGMTFPNVDGEVWTVVRATKTDYNDYRFNLSRPANGDAIKTISITRKTMKKLATSYTTIEDVLRNKDDLRMKKIYEYRNTPWYTWAETKSYK